MFEFLKSITSPHSYLGIDIGTASIKIAEIARSPDSPLLINYAIGENPESLKRLNEAIQSSFLKIDVKETAEVIKRIVSSANLKTKDVIVSLPPYAAFLAFLELPIMPNKEMLKALEYQVPKYIPLSPEEMNIDWIKIDERNDEKGYAKQMILIIAVTKEKITKYQEVFSLAGLRLKVLEIETLALIRSTLKDDAPPTIIVDIGSRSTNIGVAHKGFLRYSIQSDYASFSLTQAIANGLGIDMKRAEEMKKQKGIIVRAEEYELSTLTVPFLDVIISEAERAKAAFEKNSDIKIEQIIVSGGGANLIGFQKYAEDQTGLKVSIADSFKKIKYPKEIEPILGELGPRLGVAIGLGIREFV